MNDFLGAVVFVIISLHRWMYKLAFAFQVAMFFVGWKYEFDLYIVFWPVEFLLLWVLFLSLVFHISDGSNGNRIS